LSGGNQAEGRVGSMGGPEVSPADPRDPTIGVDFGAKSEFTRIMQEDAAAGTAAIIVSSDLDELVQIADRVLAFSRGHIVAELTREELSSKLSRTLSAGSQRRRRVNRSRAGVSAQQKIETKAPAPESSDSRAAISNAHRPRGRSRHPPPHPFDAWPARLRHRPRRCLRAAPAVDLTGSQNFPRYPRNNTTVALLAMAEMTVIATGNYDLSIAYNVGLMHITAMGC